MPTTALRTPVAHRPEERPTRGPRRPGAGLVVLRVMTVLVGLATAGITLGPRWVVVDGRSAVESWLLLHPAPSALVESLGGVEPAGNLVLFVPFAALLALSVRVRLLPVVLVLLLGAPVAVEWAQTLLPGRVPDGADVVRNTIGLLSSFVAVSALRVVAFGIARLARGSIR